MDKRKQVDRGVKAEALLKNELLQEAFDKIEGAILEGWKNSQAHEDEQRRNAYLMQRLLQNFKAHFNYIVRTGKHAESQLLKLEDSKT